MLIPEEDVISAIAGWGDRSVAHRATVPHQPVFVLYRSHHFHLVSPILCVIEFLGDDADAPALLQVLLHPIPRQNDCVLRVNDSLREDASGWYYATVVMKWHCSDQVELSILF